MSDRKNLSLVERDQLAEAVLMKKSKKKHKDKKVCGAKCMGKVIEKLNFIENGECFQTFLSLCSSKIELYFTLRNCALVKTNINLPLAYYILEFQENLFSRASRVQRRI